VVKSGCLIFSISAKIGYGGNDKKFADIYTIQKECYISADVSNRSSGVNLNVALQSKIGKYFVKSELMGRMGL
jgi:hypothetical protein